MGSLTTLLFTFAGRVNRAKYWLAIVIYLAISILLIAIGLIMAGNTLLAVGEEATEDVMLGLVSRSIGFSLIVLVVYIPMVISGFMVGIKRLHDRNKSGWWVLVFYVLPGVLSTLAPPDWPFLVLIAMGASFAISVWALVELGFLRGTAGPNRYGPDPLAS